MYIKNSMIMAVMAAIYGSVIGFAYGDIVGGQYRFQFKDWQTLGGVLVAVATGTLAYIGVRGTQRINVFTREQDRLDTLLPGFRQANDFLMRLRVSLNYLRPRNLYQSIEVLDTAVSLRPKETIESALRRLLPLADEHVQRDLAQLLTSMMGQATLLRIGYDEVIEYQRKRAVIHTYASEVRDGVLDVARQVEESHSRECAVMAQLIKDLDEFAGVVKDRTIEAERRLKVIRSTVERFFEEE